MACHCILLILWPLLGASIIRGFYYKIIAGLQAVAQGSCHSLEGVKLEEVSLKAGAAKLMVRGKLLTPDQNASILLSDFPVALLQPLFRSMPALEHAAPAAGHLIFQSYSLICSILKFPNISECSSNSAFTYDLLL